MRQSPGGARYTRSDLSEVALGQGEVILASPYNAQVRCMREHLDAAGLNDVRVGTVDKFQGQEAAIALFSMATSSGADVPRNVEFLYSRNRLNVAVSRARCIASAGGEPGADADPVPDDGAGAACDCVVLVG